MAPKVRFAPSPTGRIHIGNTRIALMNWLIKLQQGGTFILRFDDTDLERSKQEYIDAIREDLAWLGITPDEENKQSDRFASYDEAAEKLKQQGLLYPCYETPDELDRRRKRQLARGLPPVYDRKALELTEEDKASIEAEGRKPHWRFKLTHEKITWTDLVRGEQSIEASSLSDPILIREDGSYLYTLPSCVDDIEMEITHVVRGEDHVANTAAQIQIFRALNGKAPIFAHTNLLVAADGKGFSKRDGSLGIGTLREEGIEPLSIAIHATLIGSSEAVRPLQDMQELSTYFAFDKISRAPAKFDLEELSNLNTKIIQDLPYAAVKDRLSLIDSEITEDFWLAIRGNIAKVNETAKWLPLVKDSITPVIDDEDKEFIATALALLPEGEFTRETWKTWTNAVKKETGRKGRGLFMPLRKALTGLPHGPELDVMLPLIGREKTVARLA